MKSRFRGPVDSEIPSVQPSVDCRTEATDVTRSVTEGISGSRAKLFLTLDNPVLRRDLLVRHSLQRLSKSNRTLLLTGFGMLALLINACVFRLVSLADRDTCKVSYFVITVVFQTSVAIFLSASHAAGSITIEREKQTWNALLLTRLSSLEILTGKLFGSITAIIILQVVFLPVVIVTALRGQIQVTSLIFTQLSIAVMTVIFGIVGLFSSWMCRRTQTAQQLALAACAALLAAPVCLATVNSKVGVLEDSMVLLNLSPWYMMILLNVENPSVMSGRNLVWVDVTLFYFALVVTAWLLTSVMVRRLHQGPSDMSP